MPLKNTEHQLLTHLSVDHRFLKYDNNKIFM